jgi:hypothetical protein
MMKLLRLIEALERIADALEKHLPPELQIQQPTEAQLEAMSKLPQLGITVADNETTAAREEEEDAAIRSREEKLMKEYAEYVRWREQNVTKGGRDD